MAKHGARVFTSDVPTFGCPNLQTIATRIAYIFQLHSLLIKKWTELFWLPCTLSRIDLANVFNKCE